MAKIRHWRTLSVAVIAQFASWLAAAAANFYVANGELGFNRQQIQCPGLRSAHV